MFTDPYERKRRQARQLRQDRLMRVASDALPIDGDPVETRRKAVPVGACFPSVLAALQADLNKSESRFFDRLRDEWPRLFPNSPARPGRWQSGRIVLYVSTAGQSFAVRPHLSAMKRKIRALEGAPTGNLALLVEIHA